jgi:hypothetical protein
MGSGLALFGLEKLRNSVSWTLDFLAFVPEGASRSMITNANSLTHGAQW